MVEDVKYAKDGWVVDCAIMQLMHLNKYVGFFYISFAPLGAVL